MSNFTFHGNVSSEIKQSTTPNGTTKASFSVAVTSRVSSKSGSNERETFFHRCVAFGKTAEYVLRNYASGSAISVDGEPQPTSKSINGQFENYYQVMIIDTTGIARFGQKYVEEKNASKMPNHATPNNVAAQQPVHAGFNKPQ